MRRAASPTHAKMIHGAALDSPDEQTTLLPRTTRAAAAKLAVSARVTTVLGTPSDPVCFGKSPSFLGGLCGLNK